MSERTLAIIKPDAVEKHAIGDIIVRYEQSRSEASGDTYDAVLNVDIRGVLRCA